MKNPLVLYHGSTEALDRPSLERGRPHNDYGRGFYCTENYELACEWASKIQGMPGIVNKYLLNTASLKVLDLTKKMYNILNWMAILVQNRTFTISSPISEQARDYLIANFNVETAQYDIIKGFRADDSYFSFAQDFLNNTISVEHLAQAMKLGKLGIQYALVSYEAFDKLEYVSSDTIDSQTYHLKFRERDLKARQDYVSSKLSPTDGLFMIDLIRGEIKNGDPRIQ